MFATDTSRPCAYSPMVHTMPVFLTAAGGRRMSRRLRCSRRLEAWAGMGSSSLWVLDTDQRMPFVGGCWNGRASGTFTVESDAISLRQIQCISCQNCAQVYTPALPSPWASSWTACQSHARKSRDFAQGHAVKDDKVYPCL